MRLANAGALATVLLGLVLGLAPNAALADSTQQTLINQDRTAAGLAPLGWSDCLASIAQQNAQRIADQGYLSHTNGPTLDLACGTGGTLQAGENIAYVSDGINDTEANTLFMNSAPHKANILGPYNYVATAWVVAANGYGYIAEEFLGASSLVAGPNATLNSAPAITSWGQGRLDLFVRGSDNALWHKFYAAGFGWSGWSSLGGQLADDPAAVSWGPGRIDVFSRGADNALWHIYYDASLGGWSSWTSHGGTLSSGPAVSSWAAGRLDVFTRGSDNSLQHLYYWNGWSAWISHGGQLASNPAAVSWGYGRIDVVARAADNSITHIDYDYTQGGWSAWGSLGGSLSSAPALASWGAGRLDVFARGSDNALWHAYYAGSWSSWSSLGNALVSSPGAVSWSYGRIDIFAAAANNTLLHRYYDMSGSGWSSWFSETF